MRLGPVFRISHSKLQQSLNEDWIHFDPVCAFSIDFPATHLILHQFYPSLCCFVTKKLVLLLWCWPTLILHELNYCLSLIYLLSQWILVHLQFDYNFCFSIRISPIVFLTPLPAAPLVCQSIFPGTIANWSAYQLKENRPPANAIWPPNNLLAPLNYNFIICSNWPVCHVKE